MSADPLTIAGIYIEAWRAADVDRLRSILADDVSFRGPLAEIDGADAYAASISGLFQATREIVVHHVWADGDDVLTWFDLHLTGAPATPVAQWCHVEKGRVRRVRVAFDPRAILAAGS
jgi:ketosteroid isomerase-like protein